VWGIHNDKRLGFSFFNSRPFGPPNNRNLQLPFEKNPSREYLSHDSYLDCSSIDEEDLQWVQSTLITDPSCHLGQLSNTDLAYAEKAIMNAKTISGKKKKKYGFT
jgi:hypothetical protein